MIEATFAPTGDAGDRRLEPQLARLRQDDVLALWQDVFDAARDHHGEPEGARRENRVRVAAGSCVQANAPDVGATSLRETAIDGKTGAAAEPGRPEDPRRSDVLAHPSTRQAALVAEVADERLPAHAGDRALIAQPVVRADAQAAAQPVHARSTASTTPAGRENTTTSSARSSVEPTAPALAGDASATPRAAAHSPRAQPAAAARKLQATAPDELPPAESVRVFQDAAGLQVVVRHAGMSVESAVWCAMETARQLTGDRRALLQVTLNGRSVYEAAAPAISRRAAGTIVFSC